MLIFCLMNSFFSAFMTCFTRVLRKRTTFQWINWETQRKVIRKWKKKFDRKGKVSIWYDTRIAQYWKNITKICNNNHRKKKTFKSWLYWKHVMPFMRLNKRFSFLSDYFLRFPFAEIMNILISLILKSSFTEMHLPIEYNVAHETFRTFAKNRKLP